MPIKQLLILRQKPILKQILLALTISLFLSITNALSTHAAGTANIKDDFQAVGDGITDDSDAILAAFASDYDTIEFPEGEYHFTKQLKFATGDKTIIGEKATLFIDDDYNNPYNNSSTDRNYPFLVSGVDNITIKGLRFEARETEVDISPDMYTGIINANNIHFDNCDWLAVPNLADNYMTALDFFAGWHNVSVKNSRIYMFHDYKLETGTKESGGTVYFRNFWSAAGSSNAEFINNAVYKYGPDEILWIAQNYYDPNTNVGATIDGIKVSGNRFYIGDPDHVINSYAIGLSGRNPGLLKNIQIDNNEVIANGYEEALMIQSAENMDVFNNDFYTKAYQHPTYSHTASIVGSRCRTGCLGPDGIAYSGANTPGTVKIHDNRTMTIDVAASSQNVIGVTSGTNPFDFTNNKHITINAPNVSTPINHTGDFLNNNVTINGNIYRQGGGGGIIISDTSTNVQNNTILINGYINSSVFRRGNVDLTGPITYINNTITSTQKAPNPTFVLTMTSFSMNGHPITISNNTITNGSTIELNDSFELLTVPDTGTNTVTGRNSPEIEHERSLWFMYLEDTPASAQTIQFCHNTIKGFDRKRTIQHSAGNVYYPTFDLNCN